MTNYKMEATTKTSSRFDPKNAELTTTYRNLIDSKIEAMFTNNLVAGNRNPVITNVMSLAPAVRPPGNICRPLAPKDTSKKPVSFVVYVQDIIRGPAKPKPLAPKVPVSTQVPVPRVPVSTQVPRVPVPTLIPRVPVSPQVPTEPISVLRVAASNQQAAPSSTGSPRPQAPALVLPSKVDKHIVLAIDERTIEKMRNGLDVRLNYLPQTMQRVNNMSVYTQPVTEALAVKPDTGIKYKITVGNIDTSVPAKEVYRVDPSNLELTKKFESPAIKEEPMDYDDGTAEGMEWDCLKVKQELDEYMCGSDAFETLSQTVFDVSKEGDREFINCMMQPTVVLNRLEEFSYVCI